MKRDDVGCVAMLILILIVLALMAGVWWCVGYVVVHSVNYLAQSHALPDTHTAYLYCGLLLSTISGAFKATVRRD